ncbi:hypothetical protein GA0070560_10532 [Micromonospora halophytica]|uniref:Uncharacterized protein n=1 Tax=Micromonospora halophytica TaxID=47864 RepID=A0A1C5HLK6_9ACTN|nr:hypothetical protein [Micromonospora halophytica]SCG46900.1 hypothetical protein GA0070560_10532 [Micromonospora halophytica]
MVDSQHTPARTRPAVVTISSYLLILFAVLQVISLIITLSTIGALREALDEAYRGTAANGAQNVADFAIAFTIGAAVVGLLFAIVLAVLGLFNNRGSNGTRIATWVLGGIVFCCCGFGTVSNAAGGFANNTGPTNGDMPSGEEVQRRLEEALPSWYGPVTILLAVLGLLSLLAALILLALPKSNEFFRKPKQGWEPPVPGAVYPGQPAYPATPGYPQSGYPPAPGQPGYPSAPDQPGYPSASGQPGTPQPPSGSEWQAPPGQPPSTGPADPSRPADGPDQPGGSNPPSAG